MIPPMPSCFPRAFSPPRRLLGEEAREKSITGFPPDLPNESVKIDGNRAQACSELLSQHEKREAECVSHAD
jgi:hypothetical protein